MISMHKTLTFAEKMDGRTNLEIYGFRHIQTLSNSVPLVKESEGTERCSGDKVRWDENQADFGSREPYYNHRSTTNAQTSRANAYHATQYW